MIVKLTGLKYDEIKLYRHVDIYKRPLPYTDSS